MFQGEGENAEKYAELAKDSDSYNAAAFVNMGNCSLEKGDVEKAKELYRYKKVFFNEVLP